MANIRRVFVLLAVFVCFFKLQQKIAGGDSKLTGYVIFSLSHRVVRHGCCLRVHTRIVCGCPSSRLMVTFRPSLSTTILLLLSGDIESNPGPIESSSFRGSQPLALQIALQLRGSQSLTLQTALRLRGSQFLTLQTALQLRGSQPLVLHRQLFSHSEGVKPWP